MKNILIVGYGDIATRVVTLLDRRYRVFGLIRDPAKAAHLREMGVVPIVGDLDRPRSLVRLPGLADVVLHFAPPPNQGYIDPRTKNLLAMLSRGKLPGRLVYISTSGVYGDCDGAWVDETRALSSQSTRAKRREDAEWQIRYWAMRNHVRASILRVPGIYASDRLPLERLRAGTPAIIAEEDSCTNHIHAEDLARITLAALQRAKPNRTYNASDDSQLKMGDYFDAVADVFGFPRPPRLPRAEVKSAVSPTMWSFMNESRRLLNLRMKQELNIKLLYPDVRSALSELALLAHSK